MTKTELLERIEALEARVAELEAAPAPVQLVREVSPFPNIYEYQRQPWQWPKQVWCSIVADHAAYDESGDVYQSGNVPSVWGHNTYL